VPLAASGTYKQSWVDSIRRTYSGGHRHSSRNSKLAQSARIAHKIFNGKGEPSFPRPNDLSPDDQ
jgi:hypothetical protein